jgi:two-component system, chemotaxis family, chemotaxis protein CheY
MMMPTGWNSKEATEMARILAVDDSAAMRHMVNLTLKSMGHDVVSAIDGVDGLAKASSGERIDLVITDVHMPNMDGLTFVRELRRLPLYQGVPLLVLTTEDSADMKREGREAGATAWILKPFDPDRLLATVDKVLG